MLASLFQRVKRKKSAAISEIIATLLMVVVVVGIGTTVFAFAVGGFSNFGNGFTNLVSGAGNQIAEEITIEQIVFNETAGTCSGGHNCLGANIYVRNYGVNPVTIASVYVTNATASVFVESLQLSTQVTINSGSFANIGVTGFTPDHKTTYTFSVATTLGTTVTANGEAV